MPKRYGITSDPERREKELKNEYPALAILKRSENFPTKKPLKNGKTPKKINTLAVQKLQAQFMGTPIST